MKEVKETIYLSSPGNMRDFINGCVWHDMQTELNGAVEQLRDGLEQAKDFESVLRFQECLDTIRRVLEMPKVLLETLEELEKARINQREERKL